jgi:hypothetical protein
VSGREHRGHVCGLVSRLSLFVVGAVPRRWRSLSAAHALAFDALALPLGWLGVALDGWTWVGTLTILPAAGVVVCAGSAGRGAARAMAVALISTIKGSESLKEMMTPAACRSRSLSFALRPRSDGRSMGQRTCRQRSGTLARISHHG